MACKVITCTTQTSLEITLNKSLISLNFLYCCTRASIYVLSLMCYNTEPKLSYLIQSYEILIPLHEGENTKIELSFRKQQKRTKENKYKNNT